MAPQTKNVKPIFKTSSPYTETKWPTISHDDQAVILDLVCNLLAPLGDHRKTHLQPPKGRKQKRKTKTPNDDAESKDTKTDAGSTEANNEAPPPAPAIGAHILFGINSLTRHLEGLAAKSAPPATPAAPNPHDAQDTATSLSSASRKLSMVIISHPSPSSTPAHAHLPTLLHLSTLPNANDITTESPTTNITTPTRLITLPTTADARLATSLHIPRVGALGIFEGAPGAKGLEEFVRERVGVTECKWVEEAMGAGWRGLHVQKA